MITMTNKKGKKWGNLAKSSGWAFFVMMLPVFLSCSHTSEEGLFSFPGEARLVTAFDSSINYKFKVVIPESTTDMFACIDCHKGLKINTQIRKLTQTHLDFAFNHPGFDKQNRWCYYCHSTGAFDKLVMEDGKSLEYKDSYLICQQCHLENYREWELGIHGRNEGEWAGDRTNMSCVGCHNSHTPAIQAREPKKPPLQADQIIITLK